VRPFPRYPSRDLRRRRRSAAPERRRRGGARSEGERADFRMPSQLRDRGSAGAWRSGGSGPPPLALDHPRATEGKPDAEISKPSQSRGVFPDCEARRERLRGRTSAGVKTIAATTHLRSHLIIRELRRGRLRLRSHLIVRELWWAGRRVALVRLRASTNRDEQRGESPLQARRFPLLHGARVMKCWKARHGRRDTRRASRGAPPGTGIGPVFQNRYRVFICTLKPGASTPEP
jgi:hypothetical protein